MDDTTRIIKDLVRDFRESFPDAPRYYSMKAAQAYLEKLGAEPSVSADAQNSARYRHITEVMGLRFKPSGSRCLQSLEETNAAIDAAIAALTGLG